MSIGPFIGRLLSLFTKASQQEVKQDNKPAPADNPRSSLRRPSFDLGVEAGAVVKALYGGRTN